MSPFESKDEKPQSESKELEQHESNEKSSFFTPQLKLYASQFLSSWGDRMWMFSGGLFLIELTPGSFRLVAIYEAVLALTVILMGSPVGNWVDRKTRLTAAQVSLLLQNSMVFSCTLLLCFAIIYQGHISASLNGWGLILVQVAVIFMAGLAEIGTLGARLTIEKDWIVVISQSCKTDLSTMNSVMRTLDLSTEILAPVIVGSVMSLTSVVKGGIAIGAWNVVSMIFEYSLLRHLYYIIPELQAPKAKKERNEKGLSENDDNETMMMKLKDAGRTWKHYFTHHVRNAGISFSLLFMSVVALDNFARVYLLESGVGAAALGILTAAASLSGIVGSVIFPFLHKRYGTVKSGCFGFVFEVTCLLFCVVSVFAPGTLFVPSALWNPNHQTLNLSLPSNFSNHSIDSTSSLVILELDYTNQSYEINSQNNSTNSAMDFYYPLNLTEEMKLMNKMNFVNISDLPEATNARDYTSNVLLLIGIISSRMGLWIADLATTQILQERVAESERGGINGVQFSLNKIFTMLRAGVLIILESMETFGYLVLMSFTFVLMGTLLFCRFTYVDHKMSKISGEFGSIENGKQNEKEKKFTPYDEVTIF